MEMSFSFKPDEKNNKYMNSSVLWSTLVSVTVGAVLVPLSFHMVKHALEREQLPRWSGDVQGCVRVFNFLFPTRKRAHKHPC